jgi:AcrR family transcriptional regulator
LLTAAGRLLDGGGDSALTIRAVAREVRAAPQSVYLHFGNREELLWSVLTERFADLDRQLQDAEAGGPDALSRLRGRCIAYCRYGLAQPHRYRVLLDRQAPKHFDLQASEFPGSKVFEGFENAVRAVLLEPNPGDRIQPGTAFIATTDLLATLHGGVLFRTGTPSFPWGPIEALVDRTLERLTSPAPTERTGSRRS